MALDITALVDYIKEDPDQLVYRSLFTGKTASIIASKGNLMTGVKFAEKINVLTTDAIFQNAAGCSRTPSGTTSLTQRQVTIAEIAVVEDICVKTLNKKYLSQKLSAGSRGIDIPFEKEFTDLKIGIVAEQLETMIWQGDTGSANANLLLTNGFIKLIDTAAASVNGNPTGITVATGITESNIKLITRNMWQKLPAKVQGKEDVIIGCGWDTFQTFIGSYTDQNLFAYAPAGSEVSAANGEVVIPGTSYKLVALHGLDGTNRLFAMRTSNLFAGTDLENEQEKFELMPDQFKNFLRLQVEFKYGVNVAFPDEIVSFKLV